MVLPITEKKGTYCIIFRLNSFSFTTRGRKRFSLKEGLYVYVGSAFGTGGLRGRILRHLKKDKPKHWHFDFITTHPSFEPLEIWLFEEQKVDSVYGDLVYVNAKNTDKIVRYWKSKPFKEGLFKKGWHPAHPTFFVRKEVYNKCGLFNLNFKIAADYELMLRFLEKCKISSSYIPEIFVKMRVGGESNQSIKNIIKANIESYKAWKANDLKIHPFRMFAKPLSKVFQYFKL